MPSGLTLGPYAVVRLVGSQLLSRKLGVPTANIPGRSLTYCEFEARRVVWMLTSVSHSMNSPKVRKKISHAGSCGITR